MNEFVKQKNKLLIETTIKNLEKRNMNGYYAQNAQEAVKLALSFIDENTSVGWGGSVTMDELHIKDALQNVNCVLIDRDKACTPDERKSIMKKALTADTFIMSTNAISLDGELVNIDGNGNRVSALCYGPNQIIILCGVNKIEKDLHAAIQRAHEKAAVANAIRLKYDTPCAKIGTCVNCISKDCLCSDIVITRFNKTPGRIKVIFINEEFGY